MWRPEVLRRPDAADRAAIETLLADVHARTGRPPLSDARLAELMAGDATGVGAHDDGALVAWAQYAPAADGWTLEIAADTGTGTDTDEPTDLGLLVGAALDAIAQEGGGHVRWWTSDERTAAAAEGLGFTHERALHQMHVDLPVADHTDIVTRPFEVGRDEAAWLEVNNAAFGWHPEQGGWDEATLRRREAEPWFDPAGFRLHERDGRLVAFCWTKIHHDQVPVTGEIYVIAVHPDAHGHGLGRALTLAGLQHIVATGVHRGMLYVDRDNTAAVSLYLRLGFTITRTDQALVRTVTESGSTT